MLFEANPLTNDPNKAMGWKFNTCHETSMQRIEFDNCLGTKRAHFTVKCWIYLAVIEVRQLKLRLSKILVDKKMKE